MRGEAEVFPVKEEHLYNEAKTEQITSRMTKVDLLLPQEFSNLLIITTEIASKFKQVAHVYNGILFSHKTG